MGRNTPINAFDAPLKKKPTNYPEPFASKMAGRAKRPLGDLFDLSNFGVNLTSLKPGAMSALYHAHTTQDEFIYVVSGAPTLIVDGETHQLHPGDVFGFPAGGPAHQVKNLSDDEVSFLEVGDRSKGDQVRYPNDDLVAVLSPEGEWMFTHKDGAPYD